jgi:hypothetical protein
MLRVFYTISVIFFISSGAMFAQGGPGGVGNASTLSVWYDIDQMGLSNGQSVSTITDFSGNGNNVSAPAGTNEANITSNGFNGRDVLTFNGTSDYYTSTGFTSMNNIDDFNAFFVHSGSGYGTVFMSRYTNYSNAFGFRDFETNGTIVGNGPRSTSASTTVSTSYLAGFNYHRLAWSNAANTFTGYLNATAYQTKTNASGTPTTNQEFTVGKLTFANFAYFNGSLAELIIFDSQIGTARLNLVENYLAAKYGVTITADLYAFEATHPNEVAGIGRESASDLNNDAQGTGIVRINNPSSLSDGDYLLFGHDGGALSGTGSSAVTGIENEVARSWVADLNTGNVGTVDISFNIGSVPFSLGADPAEYRLLLDNDGDFSNGGTTVSAIGPTGTTTISFSGVDLYTDGPYFKLAHTGDATLCTAFLPGDWDNPFIWSCPGFPDSTNSAELDAGVTVTITGAESVNDLTLQVSSSLVLNPGTSLIIKGQLIVENGASIVADPSSTILFRGLSGGQECTNNTGSPITFGNVLINNADQVDFTNSDYSIAGGLTMVNGDLNVDGDLIFTSTATAHGHLRAINGNDINAGGFTTQRFMSGRAANWNDIATLAIPTTISDLDNEIFISGVPGADGYAPSTNGGGFISLWYFDNVTQQYVAVGNVNDAMPLGRGYEAWLGDNLTNWNAKAWDFNGSTLNYIPTPLTLTSGWNLIGNPLPGFLDFEQIAADNPQINGGEYWHYDANNGNYGTISGAGSFVPPGQGFWLFCTSGFTLNLDPSTILRDDLNNSNLFKLQTDQDESFKVAVKNKGEGTVFGSAIYLRKDPQAFSGIDAMDIPPLKVPDSRAVRMWMDFNGQERMVNYVNTDEEHIEVPLYIESGLPGEFEMSFKGLEYFEDYQCFNLLNEASGEQIEIYPEASYSFTINEQLDPLNMKILISKKDYADCMAPTSFSDNEVRVFSNDKMIHTDFYLDKTVEANITVMNSLGQVIRTERATVSYNRNSIDMSSAQAGIYFVNIQINGQTKTEKVILQ